VDPSQITGWRWTAVVAVVTVAVFGLLLVLGESNPAGTFSFPAGMVAIGVVGGLLARRTADLLGVLAGIVLALEALALREVTEHGASIQTFSIMLGIALVPGVFAAGLGLAILGVRRAVGGVGGRALLVRGAAIGVVLAGLAALYVFLASRPTRIDSYRVAGDREIIVTVIGGNATWCRLTSVAETATDVTVGAACVSLILGPTTAVGIPVDLPVKLAQPLADRLVRDLDGGVVREVEASGS
jgi:hypothetical protein